MEEKQYVSYGCCNGSCGGDLEITGCRFSLAPMTDRYIEIILDAIAKVDTSGVYAMTDRLSTIYRGERRHVLDAAAACFVHAWRPDVHMTMEAMVSKGCPGDVDEDRVFATNATAPNATNIALHHFPVSAKICLYPMGIENYMEHIAAVVNRAIDLGLYASSGHYATILEGDVQALFAYFDEITAYCSEKLRHYILHISLSVNSPTK